MSESVSFDQLLCWKHFLYKCHMLLQRTTRLSSICTFRDMSVFFSLMRASVSPDKMWFSVYVNLTRAANWLESWHDLWGVSESSSCAFLSSLQVLTGGEETLVRCVLGRALRLQMASSHHHWEELMRQLSAKRARWRLGPAVLCWTRRSSDRSVSDTSYLK